MGRLLFFASFNLGAYLVLRRLWPSFRAGARRWVFAGLAALAVGAWAVPLALGLGLNGAIPLPLLGMGLKLFGSAWVVSCLLVILFGLPFALARRRDAAAVAPQGVDMGRRGFLGQLGRAVPAVAVVTGAGGVANGSARFTVRREEVKLRNLPRALDGFTIGQITDVHVGAFIDTDYVRQAVMAMNAARVDLQVMTGDLIDDLEHLDGTMAALELCQAPHGMLSILGNHEHWRGLPAIRAAYEESARKGSPVRLLVDEAHVLEHAGQKLRVVGVDYPMSATGSLRAGKEDRMKESAEVAFQGASADEVVLCLSHHPDFFPLAAEKGARLTLSGHTHGGQVAFFGVPAFGFAFKHMLGRYRRGENHLYVSGGTGHWLPFRVGVPAEVTLLTLRAV